MRQGVIDVLCGAPVNWTSTVPQLGVFTLHFLLPDHKAWDAMMASDAVTGYYFDLVRKAGAEPLAIGETGYRQISNSKHPILKPDDLKGLKVRVVGSPMYGEIMSSMGANPTLMSWATRSRRSPRAPSTRRRTRSRSFSPPRSTRSARST